MTVLAQESSQQQFTITPLGEHTGAKVTGLDLRQPLDAVAKQTLNAALVDYCCLVFPDQEFSPDDYVQAVSYFGKPVEQNYSLYHLEDNPLINTVSNLHLGPEGKRVYHSAYWHSDHTNRECPPDYTVLYGVELPDQGGQTGIMNTRAGYKALPDSLKQRLEGLETFNVQKGSAAKKSSLKQVMDKDWVQFEKPMPHPLVRTHPVNGTKAIYFHRGKVENITGMSPQESQGFIEELIGHLEKPEYIYAHEWQVGDMLIWDNRSAMHMAYPNFDLEQHRLLHRIITDGSRPF